MSSEADLERMSQREKRLVNRRLSTETATSSVTTPKKSTRQSSKLKPITEKETEPKPKAKSKREKKNNDDDDASSVSTEHSMPKCHVVLETLRPSDLDENDKLVSSVPKTRSRKKSTLTEENLAAHSPAPARRTTRTASVLSEETTSTKPSTSTRRMSTRRTSVAASTSAMTATPKRELRSTRATSNSSENISVKSQSRRKNSTPEPQTPKSAKKRGISRLNKKLDTSDSEEEAENPNVKKERPSPDLSEKVEEQPQALGPIVEDTFATPSGKAFNEESIICIEDSDEESGAYGTPAKADQTQAAGVLSMDASTNDKSFEKADQDQGAEVLSTATSTNDNKSLEEADQDQAIELISTVTSTNAANPDTESPEEAVESNEAVELMSTVTGSNEVTSGVESPREEIVQNQAVELESTIITTTTIASNELLSVVMKSEAREGRPSISKWPKAKLKSEEEEPMDLGDSNGEEHSINKSGNLFGRINEILAAATAISGTNENQSSASPDMFSADVTISETPDAPKETVVLIDGKSVRVREAVTPSKIASPLNKTAQLMKAALSSELAASPKAKSRPPPKSVDIVSNESNANADEVSEAPSTGEKSPKISPSKSMNEIVERIALTTMVVSKESAPAVEPIESSQEKAPEPATADPSTAKDTTPVAAAAVSEQMEESLLMSEEDVADSTLDVLAQTDQLINELVEDLPTTSANTVEQEFEEMFAESSEATAAIEQPSVTPNHIVETRTAKSLEQTLEENIVKSPKSAVDVSTGNAAQSAVIHTPKSVVKIRSVQSPKSPVIENVTQTPKIVVEARSVQTSKTVVEARSVQTPKTVVEDHSTQTPKAVNRALQTPKEDAEGEGTANMATPRQVAQLKRQDTPHPSTAILNANVADSDENAKANLEEHLKGSRDKLKEMSANWSQSIKRNSIDLPYIDGLGVQNKSATGAVEEVTPKRFIAARNRLEDSEESDPDQDQDKDEEPEKPRNEFIVDEADEIDGYQSGDSMDSEERREIEENEIDEEGRSLGSEDSASGDETDDENDSFIVPDDEEDDGTGSDPDDDEFDRLVSTPKYRRMIVGSDSESDDNDETVNVKNKSLVAAVLSGSKNTPTKVAIVVAEEPTVNEEVVENAQTETTAVETSPPVQIVITDASIVETSQSNEASESSTQLSAVNDDFIVSETAGPDSNAAEGENKSANRSGFKESDRVSPEVAASSSKPKKRNVSMSFVVEDTPAEIAIAVNQSVSKVAAEFTETENAPTPEKEASASMAEESASKVHESTDSSQEGDGDDDRIHYSLNKSHPKIVEIITKALLNASNMDSEHEEAESSEDEQTPASSDKTVVDTAVSNNKSLAKVKNIERKQASDCDDDNILYSFNEAHPANATLLRLMRASPRTEATKDHINQGEQNPPVLNSSANASAKANKSVEKTLTPKQDKENVSANQLSAAVQSSVNRSLPGDENATSAFKTFLKKTENKTLGDMETNQTLQVNPLSMHFDVNASNLGRSSTPNQKALLKTRAVAATQSTAVEPKEPSADDSAPAESTSISMISRPNVSKSPRETNNNEDSRKDTPSDVPLKTTSLADILNRCESELNKSEEKKKKQKSENVEDDERQLEKKEKKKLKKAEKLAARAAVEEKERQRLEEVAVERKIRKEAKSSSHVQDDQQPSTSKASTSTQSNTSGKRLRKKRDDSAERIESNGGEQPKSKKPKRLRILTASGPFDESPMTPPRVQFGFIETPFPPTPRGFKVQLVSKNSPKTMKAKKRRRVVDFDEPSNVLPKPKWNVESLFDDFEQTQNKKRHRGSSEIHIYNSGPTEFIVKPLEPTKRRKQPSSSLIPAELMEFRQKNLYRKGIPRQDARTLLRNREKIAMSKRL